MSDFLIQTMVWTGVLIAFVLLIRRPVAAIFGAKAAYALWALPMIRLVLPPLVLPAWLAPVAEPVAGTASAAHPAYESAALVPDTLAAVPAAPEPSLLANIAGVDWTGLLIAVWLAGAVVFLVRRYSLYFAMRRELLAQARPMGEAGRVRLVETPVADGPVAFGVIDKVIALPSGFMAGRDRAARDLALAHELAHHRGRDLLCNMLVQPLFALHWFSPLAAWGWRALRRDQEAACDARVMANCPRESRAAYATVIAHFATQPNARTRLALAAPMACPVLGDRSIVQRLKSLAMTDLSARRRWAGRALIAGAALAVPLTGSISYAKSDPVSAAEPVVPATTPASPLPAVPAVPSEQTEESDDWNDRVEAARQDRSGDASDRPSRIATTRRVIVRRETSKTGDETSVHGRTAVERDESAEHAREMADHARDMAEYARDMADMQRELAEMQSEIDRDVKEAMAEARAESRAGALAVARAPRVVNRCREGQKSVTQTVTSDGKQTIYVCQSIATAEAQKALKIARLQITRERNMSADDRATALRALDQAERGLRVH